MRGSNVALLCCALVAFTAFLFHDITKEARANASDAAAAAALLHQAAPAQVRNNCHVKEETITLTTTAQLLKHTDDAGDPTHDSLSCYTDDDGTTTFFVGDASVTTGTGQEYSSSAVNGSRLSMDVQWVYALVASSTEDLKCVYRYC